jgi:hypothetical protein
MPVLARPLEGGEEGETVMDSLWPKKEDVQHVRWSVRLSLVRLDQKEASLLIDPFLAQVGNMYR